MIPRTLLCVGVHRIVPAATATIRRYKTVLVSAVSGGVDSSVATALLQEQYGDDPSVTLQTVHMSNWDPHDDDSLTATTTAVCTSERDWYNAVQLTDHLQLRTACHRITALSSTYWVTTFEPFVEDLHQRGIMGNPDVNCNTHVKFKALPEYLQTRYGNNRNNNNVWLATGHYARLWYQYRPIPECVEQAVETSRDYATLDALRASDSSNPLLLAAADRSKDQSYFLSGCSAAAFRKVLFPLGDYYKKENNHQHPQQQQTQRRPTVRELAAQLQLPAATQRESMGLCFVGKRQAGFRNFIQHYLPAPTRRLQFVNVDTGTLLYQTDRPEHHVLYTPGQGARLPGLQEKYFCVDHNHYRNAHPHPQQQQQQQHHENDNYFHTITVCAGTHHPALYSDSLVVQSMHWMVDDSILTALMRMQSSSLFSSSLTLSSCQVNRRLRAQCRVRHLQPLVDCTLVLEEDHNNNNNNNNVTVVLDQPLRGITVGQHAVFYVLDGLVCLGGGPIHHRGPSYWEQGRVLPSRHHLVGHNEINAVVANATTKTTISGGNDLADDVEPNETTTRFCAT